MERRDKGLEVPATKWERRLPWIAGGVAAVVALIGGVWAFAANGAFEPRPPTGTAAAATATAEQIEPTALAPTHPENTWIEWASDEATAGAYRIGGFTLELGTVREEGMITPEITVTADGGLATTVTGQGTGWDTARADFAVVSLRRGDPARQVLFSTFSGGAHCCTDVTLLEVVDGAWRRVELGSRDGETPGLPRDIDGDGLAEFEFSDQRFLYAFAPYAGSWAPPGIVQVVDGQARDVSNQARFRPVYATSLASARAACTEQGNGACAAYVAIAARLGRLDEAWTFMLRAYDQADEWTLPTACRVQTAGECPAGAVVRFATFPEALQWFLGETGYTAPVWLEPMNARGPSFNCGAARASSEQLICGSERLASLDRAMATAFTRANALSADRPALRAAQRAFLAKRDALADESSLEAAYLARIRLLQAVG